MTDQRQTTDDPAASGGRPERPDPADASTDDGTTAGVRMGDWLDRLALADPDPGGGAAAAVLAGVSAALVGMVAGYEAETDEESLRERMTAHVATAERLRRDALRLADADAAASAGFAPAYALPPGDERQRLVRAAAVAACESVAELGARAASLAPVVGDLADETGAFLAADVGVAAAVLSASLRGSAITLAEDLRLAGPDGADRADLMDALAALDRAADGLDAVAGAVRRRLQPEDPASRRS